MQDGADVNAFQTNDYHRSDFVCDLHTLTTSKEFLVGSEVTAWYLCGRMS
jgi:hypothetical protein